MKLGMRSTGLNARSIRLRAAAVAGLGAIALTISAKLTAFTRDVVLSMLFGAGSETDAFFVANLIPGLLWAAFLISINVVFLPLYVRQRSRSSRAAAILATEGARIYAVLGLLMGALCAVFADMIVRWTAPEASAATLALARTLTIIMAAGFAFSGFVTVQNAIQQAHGHYVLPLSTPVLNNIIAIVGLFAAYSRADIRVAIAFAVFAWVVQAPLQRWQTRRYYSRSKSLKVRRQTVRTLTFLSVPVLLGTFLDQINIFIGLHLASQFGEGAISQLNYSSRLAVFLATTFSVLVSYFLFPRLASHAATGDDHASAKTLELGLLLIVGSTLPLAMTTILLREDVVRLVYGHGAMSGEDLASTAAAFAFFAVGAVFIAVRELFNRFFFSQQRNIAPLVVGLIAAAANLALSAWASTYLGLNGIALGASLSAILFCALQTALIHKWKPGLLGRRNLADMGWLLAASLVALAPAAALLPNLAGLPPLARLATTASVYGAAFLLAVAPLLRLRGLLPGRNLVHERS